MTELRKLKTEEKLALIKKIKEGKTIKVYNRTTVRIE